MIKIGKKLVRHMIVALCWMSGEEYEVYKHKDIIAWSLRGEEMVIYGLQRVVGKRNMSPIFPENQTTQLLPKPLIDLSEGRE